MYIVGFLLIFAGVSIFLYYLVQRLAGSSRPYTPGGEPIVEATSIRFPEPLFDVPTSPAEAPTGATQTSVTVMPIVPAEPAAPATPGMSSMPSAPSSTPVSAAPSPSSGTRLAEQTPAPDLFIAGYLYIDAQKSSVAYLDRPQQSPAESTASMQRMGQATLRWWNGSFQIDHGSGVLVLPETRLKEIRFTPGGAVFVPSVADLPAAYFFTVEAQAIREFLSQRSR